MKKRFFQLVLTAVLSVSCIATGVNVSAAPLSSEGTTEEAVTEDTAEDAQENIQENTDADNTADQAATEAAKDQEAVVTDNTNAELTDTEAAAIDQMLDQLDEIETLSSDDFHPESNYILHPYQKKILYTLE